MSFEDVGKLDVSPVKEATDSLIRNISEVIVGKRETIEMVIVALLSEGHILIEDVPGIGKTMLARATAASLGGTFKRIQFTPDLLPSDVTGIYYFNQKLMDFEFRPGPIMSNIILGDEINRATPRTQSALLEAMQERQVTIDITTRSLPRPFLVIATQNPIELEGTFPLPEAQLDRFLFRLNLNYPTEDEEKLILSRFQRDNPLDNLPSVLHVESLVTLQGLCREVYVEDSLRKYLVSLVRATRAHPDIELGASPRASLSLHLAAQAIAAVRGRSYVIPDDIKYLAIPALAHRIILKAEARLRGRSAENMIEDVVAKTPVPVEASS